MATTLTEQGAALLEFIRSQRGVDLSSYKEATLERRLAKRLQATGAADYGEYLHVLEAFPDEFDPLFQTVFINVTGFFRDPLAWQVLRGHLGVLVAGHSAPIRVWCAGVASGEEAYSVAIVLADVLGSAAFRSRVQIYATDVDEDAVRTAQRGLYSASEVNGIPADLRARYLEASADQFAVRADLRPSLHFERHDLVQDLPIAHVDLLVCRNTLMYFNHATQDRILARFHHALRDPGLLFLGRAEMLLSRRHLFEPVDGGARIFRKLEQDALLDRTER